MWIRMLGTALMLALVLYLQFGFNVKDWIQSKSDSAGTSPGQDLQP